GGPTPTMLPLNGSPAIDGAIIEANSPLADQRGILRPQGPNDDIGSVEVVPAPAAALQIISGALFLTLLSRRRRTNLLTRVRSAAATTSKGLRS
ncbi:MAG: choice-of-anchor Q domain-containing protein, partial [Myxococcota bacterium]